MAPPVRYLHAAPESLLPGCPVQAPFRAVVLVETACSQSWQAVVSEWLVSAGCLYMMAWGEACSSWDDSVDTANLERFDYKDIPESQLVMTTWHEDEPLKEVFWFSKNNSNHPTEVLRGDLLLHIAARPRESEILRAYAEA